MHRRMGKCAVTHSPAQLLYTPVNARWYFKRCNTLQLTATHCNTQLHTATHCDTLQQIRSPTPLLYTPVNVLWHFKRCNTLQHTASHCNTLQHNATHCNTLQHVATHCNILQHTCSPTSLLHTPVNALWQFQRCNTLQHTATHCDTLQHTRSPTPLLYMPVTALWHFRRCNTLQHTASQCDKLPHTATHCNTLRHTATHLLADTAALHASERPVAFQKVRREVPMCVSRPIHMCDPLPYSFTRATCHPYSSTFVTWFPYVWHYSFGTCDTTFWNVSALQHPWQCFWNFRRCVVIHSCVWHDSSMWVSWFIPMCDLTSFLWRHPLVCVTRRLYMCDTTFAYVWHDVCICVTRRLHMCHQPFNTSDGAFDISEGASWRVHVSVMMHHGVPWRCIEECYGVTMV